MARTAAQKRATARMIAANRARGRGRGIGGSRGTSAPPRRRGKGSHTYSATSIGGAAIAGYGLLSGPRAAARNLYSSGDVGGFAYNIKQSIPIIGKDPAVAQNRALVGTGVAVWAGGKILKRIVPSLRRVARVKIDKKARVALV